MQKFQEEELLENANINRQFLIRKLFTHEDKYNVHKIFGLIVLISYIYRYLWVFPFSGSLGLDFSYFTFFTLFLHTGLSCTSLVFHVLKYRLTENPLIMYEEYRIHAILFTLRGTFTSLIGLFFLICLILLLIRFC